MEMINREESSTSYLRFIVLTVLLALVTTTPQNQYWEVIRPVGTPGNEGYQIIQETTVPAAIATLPVQPYPTITRFFLETMELFKKDCLEIISPAFLILDITDTECGINDFASVGPRKRSAIVIDKLMYALQRAIDGKEKQQAKMQDFSSIPIHENMDKIVPNPKIPNPTPMISIIYEFTPM
ncbi:hypothetical protein Avbf_03491 [Armadillidium vulgare]|nr:hypothetical protein Avbf_03491 [Armadillidium vulgare]